MTYGIDTTATIITNIKTRLAAESYAANVAELAAIEELPAREISLLWHTKELVETALLRGILATIRANRRALDARVEQEDREAYARWVAAQ